MSCLAGGYAQELIALNRWGGMRPLVAPEVARSTTERLAWPQAFRCGGPSVHGWGVAETGVPVRALHRMYSSISSARWTMAGQVVAMEVCAWRRR